MCRASTQPSRLSARIRSFAVTLGALGTLTAYPLLAHFVYNDHNGYNGRVADVHIRGVDEALWRRLKAEAALRGVSIGEMLNTALKEWLKTAALPERAQ